MSLRARHALLASILAAAPVTAQEPTVHERPQFARRTVRVFDFEERSTNPFPVPQHWARAQNDPPTGRLRPGFPGWNTAELDYTVARSGIGSVHLPTRGGSTALRLEPGVIPVFPDADYLVTAFVQTRGIVHARACLRARLLTADSRPIPGGEVRSELARSEGAWRSLSCALPGDFREAAFVQIELELLQPEHAASPDLGPHQIWAQDLSGAAWFDDVSIVQLPRLEIRTESPGNIVADPERPALKFVVRDLTGEPLRAGIILRDAEGSIVDRLDDAVSSGVARPPWRPRVDRYGWYRATLDVRSAAGSVGSAWADFVWLPAAPVRGGPAHPDRARFELIADVAPSPVLDLLPEIVRRCGAGAVTLPAWGSPDESITADQIVEHAGRLSRVVDPLLDDWRTVTLSLGRLPPQLADSLGVPRDQVLGSLAAAEARPYLHPLLDKFGQSVHRWQVGLAGDSLAFARASMDADVAADLAILAALVPGPQLLAPWDADEAVPVSPVWSAGASVLAMFPFEASSDALSLLAESWGFASPGAREFDATVAFRALPPEFGGRAAADDLARRLTRFWEHFSPAEGPVASAALFNPWTWSDQRRPQLMPAPELAVWRNLADRLIGRRVVATLQAPGVHARVLASPDSTGGSAAIVVWSEVPEPAPLRLHLGDGAIALVDVFGNRTPLSPVSPEDRTYEIRVTPSPIFIEGVDAALAQFTARARLEPSFVPSTIDEHIHTLVLDNPWDTRLEGRVYIVEPGGRPGPGTTRDRSWRFAPRSFEISIAPGASQRIPLTISFGQFEEAGPKRLMIDGDLIANRDYSGVRVPVFFEIGLEDLRLDLASRWSGNQGLFVEATVTNAGTLPRTLELSCFAPDHARKRASVSDLAPGQSIVRRFAYEEAGPLRGRTIYVGVSDPMSAACLNRAIEIE